MYRVVNCCSTEGSAATAAVTDVQLVMQISRSYMIVSVCVVRVTEAFEMNGIVTDGAEQLLLLLLLINRALTVAFRQ